MTRDKSYPKGLLAIPNTKIYDFKYFQIGFGFTLHKKDIRYKPRFIYTCSRYLFNSKINDPYEQYKDAVGFLNYIFKENKNKPSRQEIGNIISIAQLIKDNYEKYIRSTNELSLSLNWKKVRERWKEIYQVDKRKIQSKLALKKIDPSKRKGKKYFHDLKKADQRERNTAIRRMNTKLRELEKDYEILLSLTKSQSRSNPQYRSNMDKLDTKKWEIIRLRRTIENIDPTLIPEEEFNRVKIHMEREIKSQLKLVSHTDKQTGKAKVGLKEDQSVDWGKFSFGYWGSHVRFKRKDDSDND